MPGSIAWPLNLIEKIIYDIAALFKLLTSVLKLSTNVGSASCPIDRLHTFLALSGNSLMSADVISLPHLWQVFMSIKVKLDQILFRAVYGENDNPSI